MYMYVVNFAHLSCNVWAIARKLFFLDFEETFCGFWAYFYALLGFYKMNGFV